ncbi:MAG: DUF4388 domain-containing protein [Candidatus Edwardsbacteria bacterium]
MTNAKLKMQGRISDFPFPVLMGFFATTKKSGSLEVRCSEESGLLWFAEGKPVHATCRNYVGLTALKHILSWSEGSFRFSRGTAPTIRTIYLSTEEAISLAQELRTKKNKC